MKNRASDRSDGGSVRRDQQSFAVWKPGAGFSGRLRFDGVELNEDVLSLRFWCHDIQKSVMLHTDTHLLFQYSNESANFLEFDQLPINEYRMWVSESSDWLNEVSTKSAGVFEGLVIKHFLFVFSNVSIEVICLGEPKIAIE